MVVQPVVLVVMPHEQAANGHERGKEDDPVDHKSGLAVVPIVFILEF